MADILSVWGLAAVVAAYLIGSLSFAVIVSKFYGLDDPRSYGSKAWWPCCLPDGCNRISA